MDDQVGSGRRVGGWSVERASRGKRCKKLFLLNQNRKRDAVLSCHGRCCEVETRLVMGKGGRTWGRNTKRSGTGDQVRSGIALHVV